MRPDDLRPTRELHPAFYGSYDWHSCVHMHWLLARAAAAFPGAARSGAAIDALLDRHLAPAAIAGECAYLARPGTQSFERTYGWAWLLKLAAELAAASDERARRWAAHRAARRRRSSPRYLAYLPKAHYPIRYGIHPNSAFGLALRARLRAQCRRAGARATPCTATARRGTAPIATRRRRGSLPARISCRRR